MLEMLRRFRAIEKEGQWVWDKTWGDRGTRRTAKACLAAVTVCRGRCGESGGGNHGIYLGRGIVCQETRIWGLRGQRIEMLKFAHLGTRRNAYVTLCNADVTPTYAVTVEVTVAVTVQKGGIDCCGRSGV
jgi:hypothetical protein